MPDDTTTPAASDEYASVPVAPDTEAAKWEAKYCVTREENIRLHEEMTRQLQALAVAALALDQLADLPNGGQVARAALITIQSLTKEAAHD